MSRDHETVLLLYGFLYMEKNVQKSKSNQESTLVAKSSFGVEHGGQGAGLTKGH